MTKNYLIGTEPEAHKAPEPDKTDHRSVSGTTHARKTTKTDARAHIDALRRELRGE